MQKAKRNNQSRVQDAKQMTKQAMRTTPFPAHRRYGSAEKQTKNFDDSSGKTKHDLHSPYRCSGKCSINPFDGHLLAPNELNTQT